MKKTLKSMTAIALCATMLFTTAAVASAEEIGDSTEATATTTAIKPGDETQEMVIVWKYRIYNGQKQKRRWNETLHIWVDLMWINC